MVLGRRAGPASPPAPGRGTGSRCRQKRRRIPILTLQGGGSDGAVAVGILIGALGEPVWRDVARLGAVGAPHEMRIHYPPSVLYPQVNDMSDAIETRYGALAEGACCLSCGAAVGYIKALPGQICVDLGSGRGTDVLRLAEQVAPGGRAYGIDLTDAMLEKSRKTAAKLGIPNAEFLRADLGALPLPDATADWVTSNCVLNHADDKAQVWREIARILKPSGRFVVSDIYAVEPVPELYRRDPTAVAECWAGAIEKGEYLAAIAGAGLVDVQILDESEPYGKGKVDVVSFTITGARPAANGLPGAVKRCCCC